MRTIVAFDFDGTLTKKDSFIEFIKFSKGRLVFYKKLPVLACYWIAFKLNFIKRDDAKEKVFEIFFKGISIVEFNEQSSLFSNEIDKFLRKDTLKTIKQYLKEDFDLIIISASIDNWIQPWAYRNKINIVLATKVEVDSNGLLTGKFCSANCRGKEKVNRLLDIFPNREEYRLIAYGDSLGDKELINFADEGYWRRIK